MTKKRTLFLFALTFILFAASLVLFISSASTAYADDDTDSLASETVTLKVAFPHVYGLSEINEKGERAGMVVDYLNEIANYTGWEYEYIDIVNVEDMFSDFRAGKYDIMGGSFKPAEGSVDDGRAYVDYHMGYSKSVLFARWEDSTIKNYDLSSLNGKKIGVYENAKRNIKGLKQYLEINNLNCEIVAYSYAEYSKDGNLYRFLENGDVDMLLGNITETADRFRTVVSYDGQPYYFVCQPDAPKVLEQLNYALEQIYESNPNFAQETYLANFEDINAINVKLTAKEKAFIENNEIRIAVPDNIHPVYCQTDTSEYWHDGILYDVMKIISEKTGLKYKYVAAENFGDSISKVKAGEADVVGIYLDNIEAAAGNGLSVTKEYTTVEMTLVKNRSATYPGNNLTVGIIEGRELATEVNATVKKYGNVKDLLSAVNSGKIDLAYGIAALFEKLTQENYFSNIVSVSMIDSIAKVRFGVLRPADTPLFTILNKGLGMISSEEYSEILGRNIGSIGADYTFRSFIYANPVWFTVIVGTVVVLIMLVIVFSMRYRVKSQKMAIALEKSDAVSRSKSEFLSRMSHEIRTPMNAITGLTDIVLMHDNVPESVQDSLVKIRASSKYLLSLLNDILDMSRIENNMMTLASIPFSMERMLEVEHSMMISEAERKGVTLEFHNNVANVFFSGDEIRLKQVLTNLISNAIKFTPSGGRIDVTVSDDPNAEGNILFSVKDTGTGVSEADKERIFNTFEQAGDNISQSVGTGLGLPISKSIVELMNGELCLNTELGKGSEFYFSVNLPISEISDKVEVAKEDEKDFLKGLRILLAEDNDLNADITCDILEMAGATVVRATDGKQTVEMYEAEPDKFDIILMDIRMPNMNGLEAATAIRQLTIDSAAVVPIVAMTANSFQDDAAAAINAGMNYFIAKPIDVKVLYSVLQSTKNIKEN